MQYLTAGETNNTVPSIVCGACMQPANFRYTVLPYAFISLPANCWILWLMKSSPAFWTDRMKVCEFHMVLAELLFGFLGTPLIIMSFHFNAEVTRMVLGLILIIFKARIQFQSAVCIERYLAVVHPLHYLKFRCLRYRMSLCCVIWLETIQLHVFQMLLCKVILFQTHTVYFAFVFFTNCYCSISVLRALKQPSPGEGDRKKGCQYGCDLPGDCSYKLSTFVNCYPSQWHDRLWHHLYDRGIYPLIYFHRAGKKTNKKQILCKRFLSSTALESAFFLPIVPTVILRTNWLACQM